MNVFGVGLPEMAVIGAVALLVFGPKRLPELGRTLGKTLKGFQVRIQGIRAGNQQSDGGAGISAQW